MSTISYTPGHSENTTSFMSRRSLQSHGQYFLEYLAGGVSVLDCGCGPGTITLGIANHIVPGRVVGVDSEESQIARAIANAEHEGVHNVSYQTADCCSLPFQEGTFDRVFSHALMEHLSDPIHALREFHRVLRPGGIAGICSPDWHGLLVAPATPELISALDSYASLQSANGGNLRIGHSLGEKLVAAGFAGVRMNARYECYPSLDLIGEYLALQLERDGDTESARTIRVWCWDQLGLFAQAWVSAVGRKDQ